MRILLIDPDAANFRDLTVQFVPHPEVEFLRVASAAEAVPALRTTGCEVALISVHLADENAFELSARLKVEFPSLRTGFLANEATPEIVSAGAAYSTLGLLSNPLTPEKLLGVLERLNALPAVEVAAGISTGDAEKNPFAGMGIIEVLQWCHSRGSTGRLTVFGGGREGAIYFNVGMVAHAEVSGLEGEEAAYEIICWEKVQLVFDATVGSPKITISKDIENLLAEGNRRRLERGSRTDQDLRQEAMNEQLAGRMVGPFQVLKRIETDAWGALYEAIQVAVHRPVELKILNPVMYGSPEHIQHFVAFVGAMAKTQNPYITVVYEAGESNGLIFFARERIFGTSLSDRHQQGKLLSEEDALQVIINIGEALNHLSKNGVLHEPLLESHILLPDVGVPKLKNNVAVQGAEVSAGEADEILRMATIISGTLPNPDAASQEFRVLLQEMTASGQGGTAVWDQLLAKAHQLELNRRAMQAVIPKSSHKLSAINLPTVSSPWSKRIGIGAAVLALLGVIGWHLFMGPNRGASDVDTMIRIPAGEFIYQAGEKLSLPSFRIDKYEVTIGQYRKFLEAWKKGKGTIVEHPKVDWAKDHTPDQWEKINLAIAKKSSFDGVMIYDNTPVFNVDFYDAWAYAKWAGKRLPVEQELEKAARGPAGSLYPWGDKFIFNHANTGADIADGFRLWAPVGAMKKDKSFYGVMDMAGNVSEWTDSWAAHRDFPSEQVPVVRGGNWSLRDAILTQRDVTQVPRKRLRQMGFRCVTDTR